MDWSGNYNPIGSVQNRCHIITIILIKLARVSMKNLREGRERKKNLTTSRIPQLIERSCLETGFPGKSEVGFSPSKLHVILFLFFNIFYSLKGRYFLESFWTSQHSRSYAWVSSCAWHKSLKTGTSFQQQAQHDHKFGKQFMLPDAFTVS